MQTLTETTTPTFWSRFNFPAIGYTLLPVLLCLRYVNSPPDPRTYGPSHWFLNYHHGFMRRALVGQLFASFPFLSWRSIYLIEAAVLLVLVVLTYLVFRSILFGTLDERRLAAFLLAAPAFLPHLAILGGEIDNFMYIPLLMSAWMLMRLRNHIGLLLVTLAVCVGLAIHEAFLLMFYPLLLALIIDLLHQRRLKAAAVAVHGAVVSLCFVVIIFFGKLHGERADWLHEAQGRTDMPIESTVFMALHNTLAEQVRFVIPRYTHLFLRGLLLTFILSIPYGIILWKLIRSSVRSRGYSVPMQRFVLLLFFAPLLLLPLGHDAMRWTAALCIDMSLYVLFIYQEDLAGPRNLEARSSLSLWNSNPAIGATLVYLVALGPWALAGSHLMTNINNIFRR